MKQIFSIVLLCIGFCLHSFGQKTAQEFFNVSSKLYAEKQEEAALYTVSRGCELFESDSSLAQLKRLIEKNDKNNKNDKNQQNQQKDKNQGNGDQKQQQNQSGQDQKQDQQQNGQNNKQQNQQNQQQQQQQSAQNEGKDDKQNKDGSNQPKDKKGQISEIQAEMLLDAIDNDDKAIQQRLKIQQQNRQNQNRIEKNW